MSLLSKVTSGVKMHPLAIMVMGRPGIGKSTLGSNAKNPIYMGAEDTNSLDVSRFPKIIEWNQVHECVDSLINEKHEFKTLVIDTLDSIEPLLHRQICKESSVKSLELAYGGYGKGYTRAAEMFLDFRNKLELLRAKGMNILILAHTESKVFEDPMLGVSYRKYEMKMHKKAFPIFSEWVDAVLFADFETFKTDNDKPVGVGKRIMYTEARPGFEAKNRFNLPYIVDLDWGILCGHIMNFYNDSKGETK